MDTKALAFEFKCVIAFLSGAIIFGVGVTVGNADGQQAIRAAAVRNNVAEWVPGVDGSTTFKWKHLEVEDYLKANPNVAPPASLYPKGDPWRGITAEESIFYNPATAEDYEHMHDYLQPKDKSPK